MELVRLRLPKVAIIIPVKEINTYVRESVHHIQKLNYRHFEVLILPDSTDSAEPVRGDDRVKVIPTGPMGPAEKRDLAVRFSDAQVLAFIDDDAYPSPNWLDDALPYFEDTSVGAVGGPAVTPEEDTIWQKASGAVLSNWLGGGVHRYRYVPQKKREVDDYPSVNFLIRRDVFEKVGGFDSTFWPGEDTKLCLEVSKKQALKIIYDPRILIWHHRRELFLPHLRQVSNYALHRGFFAKIYPDTSLRVSYFLPSVFTLMLFLSPLGIVTDFWVLRATLAIICFYAMLLVVSGAQVSLEKRDFALGLLTAVGIFATHCYYGVYFLKGLMTRQLAT